MLVIPELIEANPGTGYAVGERTLATQFLLYRGCWLAVGLLAMARENRRFRRPWLVRAGWALSAVEFAWLLSRLRPQSRFLHPWEATTDAAVSAVAAAACLVAADPSEQLGELTNWAFSIGLISAATGPLASSRVRQTLTETVAAAAVYGGVGANRRGAARQEVLANALQYVAWWAGGQTFAARIRRASDQIAQADLRASVSTREIAAIRERERIHDELHAGAIRALREVRARWFDDRPTARLCAAEEALRLRHALRDSAHTSGEFATQLQRLAVEATHQGTRVEVVCDASLSPPAQIARMLLGTTEEVLTLLPAGAESPAVLRASDSSGKPIVTIRYRGESLTEEHRRSLRRAGGPHCQVTVRSTAQPGARIRVETQR